MSPKLPLSFYTGSNTTEIARGLLGKVLYTRIGRLTTAGVITETEAYLGIHDRACHAYGGRKTARTSVMYRNGGVAYVYLCYGLHALFNVVTHQEGHPHAVLIRSIAAISGEETMLRRRQVAKWNQSTLNGPGKVSQALGITVSHSGSDLTGNRIWIEDAGITVAGHAIAASPRIGVDYAGSDALLPYRFTIAPDRLQFP